MALPITIEGSDHRPMQITWKKDDGSVLDLTGATITGLITSQVGMGSTVAITGTLNIDSAVDGTFTWVYSAADIAQRGSYYVQFFAAFADETIEKSYIHDWVVGDALDV